MRFSDAELEQMVIGLSHRPQSGSWAERRTQHRTACAATATIIRCVEGAARKPMTVTLRDVSASGVGLQLKAPLPKGEKFILVLPPDLAAEVAKGVLCTVAHSKPTVGGAYEVGAEFTRLLQPAAPAVTALAPLLPALPVPQLISAFRKQYADVLTTDELAMICRIEQRIGASAPTAPETSIVAGVLGTPCTAASPSSASTAAPSANTAATSPALLPKDPSQLLTREECIKRAEQAMQARTLSGVVAQVMALAASPRGDLSDLASLVVRDPMLSARVLQAANSVSYTSTRGIVSTIPDAIRNIGCAAVRDIAITLGVFDAMPPSAPDGFNPIRCWQHSFAVATLCQRLSREADSGAAYLVGLCHDLGEILFHSHFGSEYRQVVEAQAKSGRRRDEVERAMLGITHGELVATILRCLNLPDTVRSPVEEYHAAGASGRAMSNRLARLLRLADLYAIGVLLAPSGQSPLCPISRPECRNATGNENPPAPDGVTLRGEVLGLTGMLARLSVKEEAELMSPLYPHVPIRIWLARDPSLSVFDPVTAALESMADVTARDALPAEADLVGHCGIVVVARSTSATGFTGPEIVKAAGESLPILWLTGRVDEGPSSVIAPTVWPTPLSHLAEFVQRLAA